MEIFKPQSKKSYCKGLKMKWRKEQRHIEVFFEADSVIPARAVEVLKESRSEHNSGVQVELIDFGDLLLFRQEEEG